MKKVEENVFETTWPYMTTSTIQQFLVVKYAQTAECDVLLLMMQQRQEVVIRSTANKNCHSHR